LINTDISYDDVPLEAAGAMDAKGASTAPWKTQNPRFPQLPQATVNDVLAHIGVSDVLAFEN
jgi:hypothetical protein